MKTIIKTDNKEIILSNEDLDNYNYVDLIIDDEEIGSVSVDELLSAIEIFKKIRDLSKKYEMQNT